MSEIELQVSYPVAAVRPVEATNVCVPFRAISLLLTDHRPLKKAHHFERNPEPQRLDTSPVDWDQCRLDTICYGARRLEIACDACRRSSKSAQHSVVGISAYRVDGISIDTSAVRGARHAGDDVVLGMQLVYGAPPDVVGGSGDHNVAHAEVTVYPVRS